MWVGWVQFVGDGSTEGQDTERKSGRQSERAWFMKEINSELPPSGYEIWVGIRFLIVTEAMVRVIIHKAARRVSKQKGKPGECEELFARTWERGQISNVWLGRYSVAELLPSTSCQAHLPPNITQT